jgi:SNF2 family DNA or RNA helicase
VRRGRHHTHSFAATEFSHLHADAPDAELRLPVSSEPAVREAPVSERAKDVSEAVPFPPQALAPPPRRAAVNAASRIRASATAPSQEPSSPSKRVRSAAASPRPAAARARRELVRSGDDGSSEDDLSSVSDASDSDVLVTDSDSEGGGSVGLAEGQAAVPRSAPDSHHADDADSVAFAERLAPWAAEFGLLDDAGEDESGVKRGVDSLDWSKLPSVAVGSDGRLRIPEQIWNYLYPYQRVGVEWMWSLHRQGIGGILGDEMGLGKTVQVIAFLAALQYSRVGRASLDRMTFQRPGPVLIVCPATVMHQWIGEFHAWWPPARVLLVHSSSGASRGARAQAHTEGTLLKTILERTLRLALREACVVVTTYECVRLQSEDMLRVPWDIVVLDEGHKIRNHESQVSVVCRQMPTPHRLILSGSPMQNNLRELWTLFDFVYPGRLGTQTVFMDEFATPIGVGAYANASLAQVEVAYKCACTLRDSIRPYLLRRQKVQVNIQLPEKTEQVVFCRLCPEQEREYFTFLQSREASDILAGKLNMLMGVVVLRKICNHADLVHTPANAVYGEAARSGKMMVLAELLRSWLPHGHRVLVFSQMTKMLDILELSLKRDGYQYLRMDGATPVEHRQALIRRFNDDPSVFVFLLTTRVGGLGLNLTGADRVVIYDPDWNPSTDLQARERAWRIGQRRAVCVYRLLTAGTIEEKIYHRQIFKQFLTNRVLDNPKQRRFFKANNLAELFTFTGNEAPGSTETSSLFTESVVHPAGHRAASASGTSEVGSERAGSDRRESQRSDMASRSSGEEGADDASEGSVEGDERAETLTTEDVSEGYILERLLKKNKNVRWLPLRDVESESS